MSKAKQLHVKEQVTELKRLLANRSMKTIKQMKINKLSTTISGFFFCLNGTQVLNKN